MLHSLMSLLHGYAKLSDNPFLLCVFKDSGAGSGKLCVSMV